MSNYAWLCDYGSYYVTNVYGMVIQTAEFDGVERFVLEQKKHSQIDEVEIQRLEYLKKINLDFNNAWHDKNYLENLPVKLFKKPDIDHNNMPSKNDVMFVITNGYLILSKKLYDVISQFNLGKTHFSQVYLYDIETKEQLSNIPYYFVNIAEKFEFLDVENSQGIKANSYQPEHPVRSIWAPEDDDIKLSLNTKDFNLDLWHDPKLRDSLFFSDRLVTALLNAGFSKQQLGLIRCVIQ